jgi:hypothetical protein
MHFGLETARALPQMSGADHAGHHGFDPGAVLGGLQGSPLRSDRAFARPAGLDAACAGNYVMAGRKPSDRNCGDLGWRQNLWRDLETGNAVLRERASVTFIMSLQ